MEMTLLVANRAQGHTVGYSHNGIRLSNEKGQIPGAHQRVGELRLCQRNYLE